jgi:beta-glucosidase/6-phospho-beta-glucosidase/beta-galactosidase
MKKFQDNFIWAAGGAAFQIEGATSEGGREPSVWDTFCITHQGVECADVADLSYYLFPVDVQKAVELNLKAYRFSISWSRVMKWDGAQNKMIPNEEGLHYYQTLLRYLKNANIEAIVTMYHWDLPQSLVDNLGGYARGGWLSEKIIGHFKDYSELLFTRFGKNVSMWITLNEPWTFLWQGYSDSGVYAPGLSGSGVYEYIGAKNALLAHAESVQLFKEMRMKGLMKENARITISLNINTQLPLDPKNPKDVEAADRMYEFFLGWFLRPLVTGDWPLVMKEIVGERLPSFTQTESALIKNSLDGVIGINYYTTQLCTTPPTPATNSPGWGDDVNVNNGYFPKDGIPGGTDINGKPLCGWYIGYPPGIRPCLKKISQMAPGIDIIITENGFPSSIATKEEKALSEANMLKVLKGTIEELYNAIALDNIPLIGYAAWSLMDNYEWGRYTPRFGLYSVDRDSVDLTRTPKPAALWYAKVAKNNGIE